MCHLCSPIDHLDAADRLRLEQAIDWILGHDDEIELAKKREKNPLVTKDLVSFEVNLSDALRKVAIEQGDYAMEIIGNLLDTSFEMTDAAAAELIKQVSVIWPKYGAIIADSAIPVTEETAQEIMRLTRKYIALKPEYSSLPVDWEKAFTLRDEKALEAMARKPAMWIGDYYSGPKIEQARGIVESAMAQGLGRDQTAELLKAQLGASFEDYRYWDSLASFTSTRARTWSCLTSMQEGGYDTYGILTAGDERTCPLCISMSKYEFKVAKAISTMESLFGLDAPEEAKARAPLLAWDESRNDGDGEAYYMKGGRANYIGDRSGESLQNSGLGILPIHFRCRCVPVLIETVRMFMSILFETGYINDWEMRE